MKNDQSPHYAIQSFTEKILDETSSFPLLKQLHFRLQINTKKRWRSTWCNVTYIKHVYVYFMHN